MSSLNRRLVIDDTDPQIEFSGPWFSTRDVTFVPGPNGPPFLNTLHGIAGNGSVAFSFYGSQVVIWGNVKPYNTSAGVDPYWQCFVDGNDVDLAVTYPTMFSSNYPYCAGENLAEGNHTIQMRIIVTGGEPIWIDYIEYQAPPGVALGNNWLEVPQTDPSMAYSSGWSEDNDQYTKWTYATGASMAYSFVGDAVIWGGFTPNTAGNTPGLAEYTIDGKEPTSFVIPANPGNWFNQPYFNVTGLKPGPHVLEVTNKGTGSTVPLGLTYIYTKNSSTKGSDKTAIIAGTVGGVLGALILLGIGFLLMRRRKLQRQKKAEEKASTLQRGPSMVESASTGNFVQPQLSGNNSARGGTFTPSTMTSGVQGSMDMPPGAVIAARSSTQWQHLPQPQESNSLPSSLLHQPSATQMGTTGQQPQQPALLGTNTSPVRQTTYTQNFGMAATAQDGAAFDPYR